jgi:hypothetical protein
MAAWAHRLAWLGGLGCVGAGVAVACLPDLPVGLCGNGHIDAPYENCDPGVNAPLHPECNSLCQIVCPGYVDDDSNHCYFEIQGDAAVGPTAGLAAHTLGEAETMCQEQRAHVLTLVDDDELDGVVKAFSFPWGSGTRLWSGQYQQAGGGGAYFATSTYPEPGWNVPVPPGNNLSASYCPGCFMHGVTGSTVPVIDGGTDAGIPSAIADTNVSSHDGTMAAVGPNAGAQVICEREPLGARSTPCQGDGSYCFNLVTTPSSSGKVKRYLFNPNGTNASGAAKYCASLSDAGVSSSLVVLESRAEREQLIYELSQLQLLKGGFELPSQFQFWIGLRTSVVYPPDDAGAHDGAVRDGRAHDGAVGDGGSRESGAPDAVADAAPPRKGTLEWVWEDETAVPKTTTSTSPRPTVWGNQQPPVVGVAGIYAYVNINDESYDTGLVYADPEDMSGANATYPFVCQY